MVNQRKISEYLEYLVQRGIIHSGQRDDVLNRGQEQARHVLLDKRNEIRRLMGKKRVAYSLSEVEVIASFRFRRLDIPEDLVDEECISRVLSEEKGFPFVVLDPIQLDYRLITDSFGGLFAERHLIVTLAEDEDSMTLAMAEPWNIELIQSIERIKNKKIHGVVAAKRNILHIIAEFHGFRSSMRAAEAKYGDSQFDIGNLEQLYVLSGGDYSGSEQPVVQAVDYLLNYAFDNRVSDIHIEPKRDETWVRMRIDGVLHRVHRMPRTVHAAVLSRFKTMARLDIAERRRPQDGRFKTKYKSDEVELRVSTAPTAFGEKLVARIFDPGVLIQDIERLGFFPKELEFVRRMITANTGLVLVVGPTGSGKTTTLYSSLADLNKPTTNLCTAEDPIEFNLFGINQVQMHEDIGLNFASTLRSFLRQDPDVIMVGEIRDFETAEIAIKAALTGHLVLSTLHTNDAPSTVSRMLNMGIEPFLVASSLNLIAAQRLLRKLCPDCKEPIDIPDQTLLDLGVKPEDISSYSVQHGVGCRTCNTTGHKGRIAVYEIMTMTDSLGEFVLNGASTLELKHAAIEEGMKTLRMSALTKLAQGMTSMKEVVRATAAD